MNQTLLSGLDNSDIDWLVSVSEIEQVNTGQVLKQGDKSIKTLYLIIEGNLKISLPQGTDNLLHQAFTLLEKSNVLEQELISVTTGELIGEDLLFQSELPSSKVIAESSSRLLAIPQKELQEKLEKDLAFSARFYKAIAISLSERLVKLRGKLRSKRLRRRTNASEEVLLAFGELNDSDIDWMIKNGNYQTIKADTLLFQEGRPAEKMYILLDGFASVTLAETAISPLETAFAALDNSYSVTSEREIIALKRGEILGEMPFGVSQLSSVNVRCLEDSRVLAIARNLLATKLQEDIGFSARFYRAVSLLAIERFKTTVELLGYQRRIYSSEKTLDSSVPYDDEMSDNRLDNLTLAGSRFNWMLKKIKTLNNNQQYFIKTG
ncbi:cyclic nucleotide-binding domain-containing protein [Moorena sp. SIO3B2]|uniref:cyclic nucleotide-binding domain-containing protein n=1 Tax=Moorena sp. SIO3B2 TaxID=2607827 RepID=UPI0013C64AE1|nr:cyclic nucleotide-binding domain-containing protein [Moorena sp. SIO3B2]NEP34039.1 cyclic nucleotide-binding domain-containing protein [Moorena sp. SIO3B2]